jgi:hypothetical protein
MAAKKKAASRRSTAKAKAKKAKQKKPAAKKAATPKRQAVRKKPKTAARRRKPAPVAKAPVRRVPAPSSAALIEIDQRIAIVQNNLRALAEQSSASSGSATEELLSDRIASQEAELKRLRQERDTLAKG